jgi:hypothetical protein
MVRTHLYFCNVDWLPGHKHQLTALLVWRGWKHRHLRKIYLLMALTTYLVCLISTVSGRCKKAKNALDDVAPVAGT